MVQINFAQRSVNVKIVYYGPGMSGKTTNLEVVHQRAPDANRGDLTSISTDGDRTLFFDFMPLDLGTVAGMRTLFQLYTVPGQVYYNSTRKLVLQGVDGVIFIADSSASMMEENLESLKNLQENLQEYGKDLNSLPWVIQYNKRDLPDALPIEELEAKLNPGGVPYFEGVANTGQGVFPTLKSLAARVLESIHSSAGAGANPELAGAQETAEVPPAGISGAPQAPVQPGAAAPPVTSAGTGYYPQPAMPQAPAPQAVPQAPMEQPLPQMAAENTMQPPVAGLPNAGLEPGLPATPPVTPPIAPNPAMGAAPAVPPAPAAPAGQVPLGFPQPSGNFSALPPTAAPTAAAPAAPVQPAEGGSLEGTALRLRPQGVAATGNAPVPQGMATATAARSRPLNQPRPQNSAQRAPGPAPRLKPRAAHSTPPSSGNKTLVVAGLFVGLTLVAGVLVAKFVFNAF